MEALYFLIFCKKYSSNDRNEMMCVNLAAEFSRGNAECMGGKKIRTWVQH